MRETNRGDLAQLNRVLSALMAENKTTLTPIPSRHFPSWLSEQRASLVLTTYQWGQVYFLGLKEGQLGILAREMPRVMGVWADRQTLWLSSVHSLIRFENVLQPGEIDRSCDAKYVPQMAYFTSDIDIHDVAVDADGRVVFANTLYSCLATVDETAGFKPLWKPPYISSLAAEDRCHLNGLAMEGGRPAYVTTVSRSDVADGWRDRKKNGGVVVDVRTDEIVADGLSMPHSPRVHRGRLWILEAGTGYLCHVDRSSATVERVSFMPGYARGMCFVGKYAVVCTSRPRDGQNFDGMELGANLRRRDADPRCSLQVVDLDTGDIVHWFRLEGDTSELFDVAVIEGIRRPYAVGFKGAEILNTHTHAEFGAL
ncbi:MAG: TIGR03032 family protein [Nannocystaceae bacterium]